MSSIREQKRKQLQKQRAKGEPNVDSITNKMYLEIINEK